MNGPRLIIGSVARGSDLWDRKRELERIWKALETSSVLLSAPRRFGKTSLMLRLLDSPQSGWRAFYLDTEWIKGPADFVAELLAQFREEKKSMQQFWIKANKVVSGAFDRVEKVGLADFKLSLREILKDNWRDQGKALIRLLQEIDGKTILLVDELPLLIRNIARERDEKSAAEFLFWFRGVRQMPELQEQVRWVTGGSIGMGKVLQRIGAGTKTVNDLQVIRVLAYQPEQAKAHIRALLKNEVGLQRVPGHILDKFLEVIGVPIPYFVQIFVRESINEMERCGERSFSEEMIETAYEQGVLGPYSRTYFDHYYERLDDYYGYDPELKTVAKGWLAAVARDGEVSLKDLKKLYTSLSGGSGDEDNFSYLLTELENDFYLVRDPDRGTVHFATKVLRDWWRKYPAL